MTTAIETTDVLAMLAQLSEADQARFKKLDIFQTIERAQALELAQADVEFSNQSSFVLSTGQHVSVAQLALFTVAIRLTKAEALENKACNTLGQPLPSSASDNQKKVSEAWAILKRIQNGKKAQGEEFPLNIEGRNALLGL